MLAPLVIELLVVSLLLLLTAWIRDTVHASTHERANCLHCDGTLGWGHIKRPRKTPPLDDDPRATRRARRVRRHRPLGRTPQHALSIRRQGF